MSNWKKKIKKTTQGSTRVRRTIKRCRWSASAFRASPTWRTSSTARWATTSTPTWTRSKRASPTWRKSTSRYGTESLSSRLVVNLVILVPSWTTLDVIWYFVTAFNLITKHKLCTSLTLVCVFKTVWFSWFWISPVLQGSTRYCILESQNNYWWSIKYYEFKNVVEVKEIWELVCVTQHVSESRLTAGNQKKGRRDNGYVGQTTVWNPLAKGKKKENNEWNGRVGSSIRGFSFLFLFSFEKKRRKQVWGTTTEEYEHEIEMGIEWLRLDWVARQRGLTGFWSSVTVWFGRIFAQFWSTQ